MTSVVAMPLPTSVAAFYAATCTAIRYIVHRTTLAAMPPAKRKEFEGTEQVEGGAGEEIEAEGQGTVAAAPGLLEAAH